MTARIFEGLLFAAACLICLGFAAAMATETAAIWTGRLPTISEVTASAVSGHPVWGTVLVGLSCFMLGALLVHFTGWKA